jgi:hypothetical protein
VAVEEEEEEEEALHAMMIPFTTALQRLPGMPTDADACATTNQAQLAPRVKSGTHSAVDAAHVIWNAQGNLSSTI